MEVYLTVPPIRAFLLQCHRHDSANKNLSSQSAYNIISPSFIQKSIILFISQLTNNVTPIYHKYLLH